MSAAKIAPLRLRQGKFTQIETDPAHHLAGPFLPQTPIGSNTPIRTASPPSRKQNNAESSRVARVKWFKWLVDPSFKVLAIPVVLWTNWELLSPHISPDSRNPFAPLLFVQYPHSISATGATLYVKGYLDLIFVAYHIVVFAFIRVMIYKISVPIARYWEVKKEAKIERFGEQFYAMVYFAVMGAWGMQVMFNLPTWWYDTKHYWIDYPAWQLDSSMKRYYLTHIAYWTQQFVVLGLRLEKPRKDYRELVIHHFVTMWLITWSYLMNLTWIGNAIYVSMDIPDAFLAASKLLNYMRFERLKVVSFGFLLVAWTYFRHYLNLVILWSVWNEFTLIPAKAHRWLPEAGVWMPDWIQYQMFLGIGALQLLNLFWYFLLMRILVRTIMTSETTDDRSDDEDDEDEDDKVEDKKLR